MRRMNLVCSALAVVVTGAAQAAIIDISSGTVTIAQLVGNSFIVGDKRFDIDSYTGANIAASGVTVRAVNFGLAGIGFDLVGQWQDVPGNGKGSGFDLGYRVTIIQPGFSIVDSHLQFNGFASGQGSFANVAETLFNSTGGLLTTMFVSANGALPQNQWVLEDSKNFGPQQTISVIKNFHLFANGPGGIASTSFIRQTFSQIPSPGAASLLALAGLAAARRRR